MPVFNIYDTININTNTNSNTNTKININRIHSPNDLPYVDQISFRSMQTFQDTPTLVRRDSSSDTPTSTTSQNYATDSKGCLVCPTDHAPCPACTGNTECQLRTQTCTQCAEYFCAPIDSTSGKSLPIGGIIGGVIAFVVVAALAAGFYYYFYVYRKKHPVMLDDEDSLGDDEDEDEDDDVRLRDLHSYASDGRSIHTGDEELDDENSDYNISKASSSPKTSHSNHANPLNNGNVSSNPALAGLERPNAKRSTSSSQVNRRRLSSYESFTKPQYRRGAGGAGNKTNKQSQAAQRRARQKKIIQEANAQQQHQQQLALQQRMAAAAASGQTLSSDDQLALQEYSRFDPSHHNTVYFDGNSTNRNSVATSFSTTNASNILPIAYIPGVTVRPTANNTRSIYSYDSESLFSDLNTIENASIVGDVTRGNYDSSTTLASTAESSEDEKNSDNKDDSNVNDTMTAIKAQPRLVNVERIEEEDEDEEEVSDDEVDDNMNEGTFRNDSTMGSYKKQDLNSSSTSNLNTSTLTNFVIEDPDEDEDSDVDSDIGEINRATSVRKKKRNSGANSNTASNSNSNSNTNTNTAINGNYLPDREILLDIASRGSTLGSQFQPPNLHNTGTSSTNGSLHRIDTASNNGSFVLDVEFDGGIARPGSDDSGEKSPFEDPE
ncbi:uncharacterized protein RJT21DRAFT_117096 [Scheffersomyces amazonensis]|uniref:uncharacterized protein n=1 Tax=Scheffersomyces amazonensis TaxID=1078765 RepID=UPI00315DE9C1